jgi:hypothetical protein
MSGLGQIIYQPCPGPPAPQPFIFNNLQYQRAANNVYSHQAAYNLRKNAVVTGKTYKFKSDQERMQSLIGGFAVNPRCSSSS